MLFSLQIESMHRPSLRTLSWNIDGLGSEAHYLGLNPLQRATSALSLLLSTEPRYDVLAFQEVNDDTVRYISDRLHRSGYVDVESGGSSRVAGYFTKCYVSKTSLFQLLSRAKRVPFANSIMGRDLLMFDLELKETQYVDKKLVDAPLYRQKHRIRVGVSHLESGSKNTAPGAPETRQKQLENALETLMLDGPEVGLKFFLGDLNLRDEDVKKTRVASLYTDAWEACGKAPKERFTWDSNSNSVVSRMIQGGKCGCRFDRCFYMIDETAWRIDSFKLVGKDEKPEISDHYAMAIEWQLKDASNLKLEPAKDNNGYKLGSAVASKPVPTTLAPLLPSWYNVEGHVPLDKPAKVTAKTRKRVPAAEVIEISDDEDLVGVVGDKLMVSSLPVVRAEVTGSAIEDPRIKRRKIMADAAMKRFSAA